MGRGVPTGPFFVRTRDLIPRRWPFLGPTDAGHASAPQTLGKRLLKDGRVQSSYTARVRGPWLWAVGFRSRGSAGQFQAWCQGSCRPGVRPGPAATTRDTGRASCFPRLPMGVMIGSPPQGGREVATRPRPMSQRAWRERGRSERSVRVCRSCYRRFLDFRMSS